MTPRRLVEPGEAGGCRRDVKVLSATAILALALSAAGSAKVGISIAASDTTPGVGQLVSVVVRSERRLDHDLRLMAVAPGKDIFSVVATLTGDTSRPDPNIARNGFEVRLSRLAPDRWRGTVRFRSAGRWRLVVPNGAPVGVVLPAGVARLELAVHDTCPVTRPSLPSRRYGSSRLWVTLPPAGVLRVTRNQPDDGLYGTKLGWVPDRDRNLVLTVSGRRLDAPGRMTVRSVNWGYSSDGRGSWASAVAFPNGGCWRITGRAGGTTLSYIVRVVPG